MEVKEQSTAHKDYREPGLLERYYIARSYLGFDSCVVVGAKYVGPAGEPLSKRILYPALSQVAQRHAALSASIKGAKSKEVSIGRLLSLDFSKVVQFSEVSLEDDATRNRFLESQFERPILPIEGQPLWRLIVTNDNFVVFCWSHVIGDGLSGQAFHRALLEALNYAEPETFEEVIAIPENTQLQSPLENVTDVSVSIMTFIRALIGIIIPRSWTESKVWSGNDVVAEPRLSTMVNVRSFNLTPETSALLLSPSKKNGATLTSFLHTACVGVLSTLIEMGPDFRKAEQPRNKKYTSIGTAVPVSLRSIANVDTDAFGNFVSAVYSTERLQPLNPDDISTSTFPWKTAASYAEKLRNGVPKTRETVGTIKYLFGNYEGFFLGKLGKKRQLGLEISNLGAFTINKGNGGGSGAQDWRIGRVFFTQDDRVAGNALKVSVAGGLDGSLGITISWGEGSVDGDFAEAFARELMAVVSKIQ